MTWIISIGIVLGVFLLFLSTLTVKPGCEEDIWIKVKIRRDSEIMASWCRINAKGIRFYTLDGTRIYHTKERVAIVEPCIESGVNHPIPQEDISNLLKK